MCDTNLVSARVRLCIVCACVCVCVRVCVRVNIYKRGTLQLLSYRSMTMILQAQVNSQGGMQSNHDLCQVPSLNECEGITSPPALYRQRGARRPQGPSVRRPPWAVPPPRNPKQEENK